MKNEEPMNDQNAKTEPLNMSDDDTVVMPPKDYELWMNEFPKCPKCGHDDEDWWDGMPHDAGDGYDYEAECPACNRQYKTTMFIETKFTTELA